MRVLIIQDNQDHIAKIKELYQHQQVDYAQNMDSARRNLAFNIYTLVHFDDKLGDLPTEERTRLTESHSLVVIHAEDEELGVKLQAKVPGSLLIPFRRWYDMTSHSPEMKELLSEWVEDFDSYREYLTSQ